jgi:hypothetical protein
MTEVEQAKRVSELVQKWMNILDPDEQVFIINAAVGMLLTELHVTAAHDLGNDKTAALRRLHHSLAAIERLFDSAWDDFVELKRGQLQ